MADVTVNRVVFNNTEASYVVSGLGSVNMASTIAPTPVTPTISVTGLHKFQATVKLVDQTTVDVAPGSQLIFDGALDLLDTTLTKTGFGEMAIRNGLNRGDGIVSVQEGTVSGNGTINGDLINDGGAVSPGNNLPSDRLSVPESAAWILFGLGVLAVMQFWRTPRSSIPR